MKTHFLLRFESFWVGPFCKGKFIRFKNIGHGRSKRLGGDFKDDTGRIEIVWFRGSSWIQRTLKIGEEYVLFGKPTLYKNQFNIAHPEIESALEFEAGISKTLYPLYHTSEKLKSKNIDSKAVSKLTKQLIVDLNIYAFQENLPNSIISKYGLLDRKEAFFNIHYPKSQKEQKEAEFRLKYEELFFIQLNILSAKSYRKLKYKGHVFNDYTPKKYKLETLKKL